MLISSHYSGMRRILLLVHVLVTAPSADEPGKSRYKLPGPGGLKGGPGPNYVAYVYVVLGSIIIC